MPVIHIFYCSGVDIRRLDDPGQNIVGEIMLYQKQTCRQKKHEKQPVLENHPDRSRRPSPRRRATMICIPMANPQAKVE